MQQTSIAAPATALNWFAIQVYDLDRAVKFYDAILEARMHVADFGGETIAIFPHEQSGVGGGLVVGAPSSCGTIVYLNVDGRLDRTLDLVRPAGGRIEKPKSALPNGMGFSALVVDPEGNVVGLHSNS